MTMKPEESYRREMLSFLERIKEKSLSALKGEPIIFKKGHFVGAGIMSFEREKELALKLQEEKTIKIIDGVREDKFIKGYRVFRIKLLKDFDVVYEKHRKSIEKSQDTALVPLDVEKHKTIEIVLADLEAKYNEIEGEKNEEKFLLSIANYGRYLLENKVIYPLFKPLLEQSKKDLENYKKAFDEFNKEWELLLKDIIEKAEKAGIKDDDKNPLSSQIYFLKERIKEQADYNDNYIGQYYIPYWQLTIKFRDLGKQNLINNHFIKDGEYKYLKIDEYKKRAEDEWAKFKNLRENQVWWAHYQIMRLAHGIFDLKEEDPYYKNDNIIDSIYRHEFEQIARGEKPTFKIFKKQQFEEWIRRLHKYLIPRLKFLNFSMAIGQDAATKLAEISNEYKKTLAFPLEQIKKSIQLPSGDLIKQIKELQKSYQEILSKIVLPSFPPPTHGQPGISISLGALKTPEERLLEQLIEEVRVSRQQKIIIKEVISPPTGSYKLKFYSKDGAAVYNGVDYRFTGKAKAFLTFFDSNKNTAFSIEEIKNNCNPLITHKQHYFKAYKDIRDILAYIKARLKVKNSEYFPIQKSDDSWIWIDK